MRKAIDLLSAGELLVDFVTAEFIQTLEEANLFRRIPGGSAANLAMNMARLGNKAILVACVGHDDMGGVLLDFVGKYGVDTNHCSKVDEPTSLILETRSATVSNMQAYRGADNFLSIRQFPYAKFEDISIFHTTCFALSKQPAQHVIIEAAEKAKRAGCLVSLNANYSEKIWPERREAHRLVAELSRLGAMIHISTADYANLYEAERPNSQDIIEHFMKMGAQEICISQGNEGYLAGNSSGQFFVPARKVKVKDATSISGVSDAFIAGYFTARLDGKNIQDCAISGRKMAEMKLAQVGILPVKIDRDSIYVDLEKV